MNQSPPPPADPDCSSCGAKLAPADLACSHCHSLVNAAALEQLAASARLHEERQEFGEAREVWLKALELLPPDSSQAAWVRGSTQRLAAAADNATAVNTRHLWAKKLGPFAPLALLLVKGKFLLTLFKLKFLLSLGAFVAFYWALYGIKFGLGFAALILLHEMGHFIDVKRRGLPAEMPVFLPGLGAYVRWSAIGVSTQTRAFVSLAGPLAGCIGAVVCACVWAATDDAIWIGLASLTAVLNILNLIPIWVLDGGQAIAALDKSERIILCAAAVLLAALFGQPLLLLVAAGAAYRIFTKDLPAQPSHPATVYYLVVLAALGFVSTLAPIPPPGSH